MPKSPRRQETRHEDQKAIKDFTHAMMPSPAPFATARHEHHLQGLICAVYFHLNTMRLAVSTTLESRRHAHRVEMHYTDRSTSHWAWGWRQAFILGISTSTRLAHCLALRPNSDVRVGTEDSDFSYWLQKPKGSLSPRHHATGRRKKWMASHDTSSMRRSLDVKPQSTSPPHVTSVSDSLCAKPLTIITVS